MLKKINLVLLSVFTLILVNVLGACSFKDADIDFTTEEIVLSQGESIDLSQYVRLTNLEEDDVEFKLSDSSFGTISGMNLSVTKSGRTYIYATYNGNSFATVTLCVKSVFSSPTNFVLTENEDKQTATLSWDAVCGYFADDSELTVAQSYLVTYSKTTYDEQENATTITDNVTVNTTSIVLEQGMYELSVSAVAEGYFDGSAASETQKMYIGYMTSLSNDDFSWDDGVLSWSAVSGAEYSVYVDGDVVESDITSTSIDLSSVLEKLSAGDEISVQLKISDENNEKYSSWSDEITICKLGATEFACEDGKLTFSGVRNATEYVVYVDGDENVTLSSQDDRSIDLAEYEGLHSVYVVAKSSITSTFFFHSVSETVQAYKLPTVTLAGAGSNEENSDSIRLYAQTTANPVATTVYVGSSTASIAAGDTNSSIFEHELSVGVNSLTAKQVANSSTYTSGDQTIYVLSSEVGEAISLTRVDAFSAITHSVSSEVSVFSFEELEYATGYVLQYSSDGTVFSNVDEKLYSISGGTITLTDKIENLFEPVSGKYFFKIMTTNDDDLAINSSVEKTITQLSSPTSITSSAGAETLTWENVASSYSYVLYTTDSSDFEAQTTKNIEQLDSGSTSSNSISNLTTGYYYIEIWSISDDVNTEISASDAFEGWFYVSETLESPTVSFGYDESYVSASYTGYFLSVGASANVGGFAVSIDGNDATTYSVSADTTIICLTEDFSSGSYSISVSAIGSDSTLYLQSSARSITVTRIASPTTSDISLESYVQYPTVSLSIGSRSGVTAVSISDGSTTESGTSSVSFDTSSMSDSFELTFTFEGSELNGNLFEGSEIFLSSSSSFSFDRLADPADLVYYDGYLDFTYDADEPEYFVLNIVSGSVTVTIFVPCDESENVLMSILSGAQTEISNTSGCMTADSTAYQIDLEALIEKLRSGSSTFNTYYPYLSSFQISLFAYSSEYSSADDKFVISSNNAQAKDTSNDYVSVDKISSTTISYDGTKISWTAVTSDSYETSTEYVLYYSSNGTDFVQFGSDTGSSVVYGYSTTSQTTTTAGYYYLIVTNPYYLDSAQSNTINIVKLASISSLSLTDEGTLTFSYSDTGCTGFSVVGDAGTVSLDADTKYFSISDVTSTVSASQSVSITVIGSTEASTSTFYLASDATTWTFASLSSIMPANTAIVVSNETISWTALTVENSYFEYVVLLTDGTNYKSFTTTATSLSWTSSSQLRTALNDLNGGTVTVYVYAHVKSHSILSGNVIYYAEALDVLDANGETSSLCNYASYTSGTLTKYVAPSITSVSFDDENDKTGAISSVSDIVITFTGNYGTVVDLLVEIGDSSYSLSNVEGTLVESGTYSYTITIENGASYSWSELSSGGVFVIYLYALNDNDKTAFPSSYSTVTVTKACTLSVEIEDSDIGYESTLTISSTGSDVESNIILAFSFEDENGDSVKITDDNGTAITYVGTKGTTYVYEFYVENAYNVVEYDFSSLIEKYLKNGGTVSVSAFVRSSGETYDGTDNASVLTASTPWTGSFDVVAGVSSISHTSAGFSFTSVSGVTYVITGSGGTAETDVSQSIVAKNTTVEFEIPSSFSSGTYTIRAYRDGYVASYENSFTFSFERLASIASVTVSRTNDVQVFSWDAVTGASGYYILAYLVESEDEITYIDKFTCSSISVEVLSLFGDKYAYLFLTTTSSSTLLLEFYALGGAETSTGSGTYYIDSYATQVYVTINANDSTIASFSVNDCGLLKYATEGAYYQFTSGSSTWNVVGSDGILDSTSLEEGTSSTVSIVFRGDDSAVSTEGTLYLDSATYVSTNIYSKLWDITKISSSGDGTDDVVFSLIYSNKTITFFVGTSESSILSGDVAEFEEDSTTTSYSYSFATIVALLQAKGISLDSADTLYFWIYDGTTNSLVSNYKTLSISYGNSLNYVGLVKGVVDNTTSTADYLNNYALFTYDKDALGISLTATASDGTTETGYYDFDDLTKVNIEYDSENNEYVLSDDEDYTYFAINITEFLDENFDSYSGNFTFDFVKVSLSSGVFEMSKWLSDESEAVLVYRMNSVGTVSISYGNVYWSNNDENGNMYYVYLSTDSDTSSIYKTIYTFAESTNFAVTDGTSYYVAVQAVNESDAEADASIVCSSLTYKMNSTSSGPELVRKNKISSEIVLEDGELYFSLDESDLNALVTAFASNPSTSILNEVYFESPFTFTLEQLANDSVCVRLRFTNSTTGEISLFDVPISYLLKPTDEFLAAYETLIEAFYESISTSSTTDALIDKVTDIFENGSHGISNSNTLFDDLFEKLQKGYYKMEYSLIGLSSNFNSTWIVYGSDVYVSAQPEVTVTKESTDETISAYKITFSTTEIQTTGGSSDATSYVLRLKANDSSSDQLTFLIAKGSSEWSMTLVSESETSTASVSVDSSVDGKLSLYINYKSSSILGVFGSFIETSKEYIMEIYAVGSDISFSSKTECNFVTLLDIENLTISEGEFSWTTTNARATTVIRKKYGSSSETEETISSSQTFTYSMDDVEEGARYTLKFLVQGSVSGSTVLVDSGIYTFSPIYKLASPTLSAELGLININASSNNDYIENAYTTADSFYGYRISNDKSSTASSTSYTFYETDTTTGKSTYTVGTTGMISSTSDPDYVYKLTEEGAGAFNVVMLGSSASLTSTSDATSYYIKTVSIDDSEASSKALLLKSSTSTISARMISALSSISTSDGEIVWDEVSTRTMNNDNLSLVDDYEVVYRLTISEYGTSTNSSGETTQDEKSSTVVYTAQTSFDATTVSFTEQYLKVTIQAFAASVSATAPTTGTYVELVEGGYAYGYATYDTSDEESSLYGQTIYVLMGNGKTVSNVIRITGVDEGSIDVNSDGQLTWSLTLDSIVTSKTVFDSTFKFVVLDENGEEVSGDYALQETDGVLEVTFTESGLSAGDHTFSVYVNVADDYKGTNYYVKSYSVTSDTITKLEAITSDDYEVVTSGTLEWLSFENYFANNENNIVTLIVDGTTSYTLKNDEYCIYISSEEEVTYEYKNNFVTSDNGSAYIYVDSSVQMTFVVSGKSGSGEYYLLSDQSDIYSLVRTDWGSSDVVWDEDLQAFTWEYNWNMLSGTATATGYTVTISETPLYTDSSLTTATGGKISGTLGGNVILCEQNDVSTKIYFVSSKAYYYISNDYISYVANGTTTTLTTDVMFTVVTSSGGIATICTTAGAVYQIDSSLVIEPEFIVNIKYESENHERTYTSVTDCHFQPTVVGDAITSFSVQITFGSNQLLGETLSYTGSSVTFTSFASGNGTSSDPYIITTADEFLGISLRMTKASYLTSYTTNGTTVTEEEVYYFSIEEASSDGDVQSDATITIDLSEDDRTFSGIVLSGEFSGVLNGNGATITYVSTGVQTLEENVEITSSQTKVNPDSYGTSSIVFTAGSSLFEKFTSTAIVSNLVIDASFTNGESSKALSPNSLISGLVLVNNGTISGVSISNFETNFQNTSGVLAFSGVASVNNATISDCSLTCEISVVNETKYVFAGGIAYINFGTISYCENTGGISVAMGTVGGLQVGGIASVCVVSEPTNCSNTGMISLSASSSGYISCYAGDIYAVCFTGVSTSTYSTTKYVLLTNLSNSASSSAS